jgi:hypothetical protein
MMEMYGSQEMVEVAGQVSMQDYHKIAGLAASLLLDLKRE